MAASDRTLQGLMRADLAAARAQFIAGAECAMRESHLDPDQIAGRLSALVGDLWNDLEEKARKLPRPDRRRVARQW